MNPESILVAILDLPVGSVVNLDSETVLLKWDDFVGFHSIPPDVFHLVTVRAGKDAAVTVGFVFAETSLIRRYNAVTEEVSAEPVDESTAANLCTQVRMNQIEPQRVVAYDRFIPDATAWIESTKFVTKTLLKQRGIELGGKLVPGSYDEEQESEPGSSNASTERIVDGRAASYPPIPVMKASSRHTLHAGTKRFLNTLSPSQKTTVFTAPPSTTLDLLLSSYYDSSYTDLLGDVQLSYVLFLRLHCFSSLLHWRDLVAMLSSVEAKGVEKHAELYTGFLDVLTTQVATMGDDFVDEFSGDDDNFLLPSLQQLISTVSKVVSSSKCHSDGALSAILERLTGLLETKFPTYFEDTMRPNSADLMAIDVDEDKLAENDYDVDEEEGPVVVASEEVEAANARSLELSKRKHSQTVAIDDVDSNLREQYPILFAAMNPETEDILMTCARALDEANDVSLVREAAAYLEEVEAKKKC